MDLQAGLSDGTATGSSSNDNIINLYGSATGDFFIRPNGAIEVAEDSTTDVVEFANKLRDVVLGDGITVLGDANLTGTRFYVLGDPAANRTNYLYGSVEGEASPVVEARRLRGETPSWALGSLPRSVFCAVFPRPMSDARYDG